MPKARKNIHTVIKEQTGLAKIYAEDGAFHTAAKILRELGDKVEAHAKWCDGELDKLSGRPKKPTKPKPFYEVIVQNIGKVHEGSTLRGANAVYDNYVDQSRRGYGRAANEGVILFKDSNILKEYTPIET